MVLSPLVFAQELRVAINKNVIYQWDSQKQIMTEMGLVDEARHYYSHQSYQRFLLENLRRLNECLKDVIDSERDSPENPALKQEISKTVKLVLRKCKTNGFSESSEVKEGHFFLTAAQLGVPYRVLEQFSDFRDFIERNHLGFFIEKFRHRVQVINNEMCVLFAENGNFLPWRRLRECHILDETGKLVGSYTHKGFSKINQRNWKKIPVFKQENPDLWERQYRLELCARIGNEPRGLGDHAWLRLKTPTGNIYSIGFSSEKEDHASHLLNVKTAFLVSPDYAEFSDEKFSVISSEISPETFDQLIKTLESDKTNNKLHFQLMQSNCFLYALNIFNRFSDTYIAISGYSYPTLIGYILKQRVKNKLSHKISELASKIVSFTQSRFSFISRGLSYLAHIPLVNSLTNSIIEKSSPVIGFALNLLIVALGGTKVDSSTDTLVGTRPYISSWQDMFDIQKSVFFHPFELSKFISTPRG